MNTNPILLNQNNIQTQLKQFGFQQNYTLHCLTSVHSTNQYLQELAPDPTVQYCIAEEQSGGRGRLGRSWHSPFGENIYFSARWPWHQSLVSLSGLSLVIALAIVDTLRPYLKDESLGLKWPNDILWHNQKLGGILVEIKQGISEETSIIVGIGLNINSSQQQSTPIEQPWCSLFDICYQFTDRNILIAELITQLEHYIQQFTTFGFKPFQTQWNNLDSQKNQWITVTQPSGDLQGFARGVNTKGLLRLETTEKILFIASGETSLGKFSAS